MITVSVAATPHPLHLLLPTWPVPTKQSYTASCPCKCMLTLKSCDGLAGNDGLHATISNFIWNKWTPAAMPSGTEGVLTADYVTVDWNKVDYLGTIGLFPWYTLPTSHRTVSYNSLISNCCPICAVMLSLEKRHAQSTQPHGLELQQFVASCCQLYVALLQGLCVSIEASHCSDNIQAAASPLFSASSLS